MAPEPMENRRLSSKKAIVSELLTRDDVKARETGLEFGSDTSARARQCTRKPHVSARCQQLPRLLLGWLIYRQKISSVFLRNSLA